MADAKRCHAQTIMELRGDEQDDAFAVFGYGIQAYFMMLERLIEVFFVITLLFLPVVWVYYNGNAFNHLTGLDKYFSPITLGNIGHANTECQYHFVSMEEPAKIECTKGTISKL